MTWSPEPWIIDDQGTIVGSDGSEVCDCVVGSRCADDPAGMDEENKSRIVACVNFCRQFPTKFLECRQAVNVPDSSSPEDDLMSLAHSPRFASVIAVQRN